MEHLYSLTGKSRKLGGKNKMNEITNKIKALIVSEQEELKDIEEFKNKTKTKLDSMTKRFERFFNYDCLPCGYSKPCDSYRFSENAVNLLIDKIDQQDKEIKKLKKELSKYGSYKTTDERIRDLENLYSDYKKENLQLKQSQNQKAIEELKKIKNYFLDTEDWLVDSCAIEEFIINQLKELEVQNEV